MSGQFRKTVVLLFVFISLTLLLPQSLLSPWQFTVLRDCYNHKDSLSLFKNRQLRLLCLVLYKQKCLTFPIQFLCLWSPSLSFPWSHFLIWRELNSSKIKPDSVLCSTVSFDVTMISTSKLIISALKLLSFVGFEWDFYFTIKQVKSCILQSWSYFLKVLVLNDFKFF